MNACSLCCSGGKIIQVAVCLLVLTRVSKFAMAQNTINIGFIYSGGGQYITAGVQDAVDLAVELINNRLDLLPGYQLSISYTGDSQCDPAQSQRAFFVPQLSEQSGPDNIALLGCGCSLATEPIAEISHYWNLIHMSYSSSSDVLSDRSRFPNFWRTYPVESNLASSVVSVLNQYNWKKFKILTQDELIFTSSTDVVLKTLENSNSSVTVVTSGETLLSIDNRTELNGIFNEEVRVYLLNMYPRLARRVLCAAARAKERTPDERYKYDKYVWITLGWYGEKWWKKERKLDDSINCTDADVEQFLPQTLAILQANTAENSTTPTDVELTAEQFQSRYRELLNNSGLVYEHSAFHAYDALWTLAFAMNMSIQNGGNLTDYNRLSDNITVSTIELYLADTNFTGVSGQVQLDNTGTRVADEPKILKYRDSTVSNTCGEEGPSSIERVRVAKVSNDNSLEYSVCENDSTVWPGGVPLDGSPVNQTITILLPLVVVYYCLATIGIIFSVICLLFNIIFRNRKIVKLISPNLNYAIVAGTISIYSSLYFYVFPSLDEFWVTFACHLRGWLQIGGYFLAFGTILLKLWRVYYIFSNPTVNKKKKSRIPKDWQLFIGICILLLGVAIFFSGVAIFGDYKASLVQDQEHGMGRDDNGSLIAYHNLVCSGPRDIIWIAILFGTIFLAQLIGVFLAFRTRKVEIKALNDYKYISAITYMSTIILAVMIASAIFLDDYQNADAAVFCGLLFIFTTVCLTLSFIPKMVILYKDPKGERIFQRSMSQAGTIIGGNLAEDDNTRYVELEQHCRDLEGRLAKCGEVVPTFRPRAESSFKLKSSSFSSIPPSSPLYRTTNPNLSMSAPTTPTHIITNTTLTLKNGSSDYFTETERNSTASSTEGKDVESGKA